MDGLEFTEKLVGHLVSWPFIGAVCIAVFRKQIGQFISETSELVIDKNGLRAKRREVTQQLEQGKAQLADAEVSPKPVLEKLAEEHHIPSTDVAALIQTAKHINEYGNEHTLAFAEAGAPLVVIDRAWREVAAQLYRLTQQEEPPKFSYLNGNDLFRQAAEEHLLDRKVLLAIESLLNIHNETSTSIMGWQPTKEQAAAFVSNARDVLWLLEPYLRVGYKAKG